MMDEPQCGKSLDNGWQRHNVDERERRLHDCQQTEYAEPLRLWPARPRNQREPRSIDEIDALRAAGQRGVVDDEFCPDIFDKE